MEIETIATSWSLMRTAVSSFGKIDEVLRIRTRIAESRNRIVKFSYEVIRDADGKVLAMEKRRMSFAEQWPPENDAQEI